MCRTRSGASGRSPPWSSEDSRHAGGAADYLEGKVAHWQVPERWAFIDEVPKTSVGKFDKKVLRKRYADGELDVKQRVRA